MPQPMNSLRRAVSSARTPLRPRKHSPRPRRGARGKRAGPAAVLAAAFHESGRATESQKRTSRKGATAMRPPRLPLAPLTLLLAVLCLALHARPLAGQQPQHGAQQLPPLLWGQPHTLSAALAACKAAAARDAAQETIVLDDAVTSAIVDAASTAVTLGVRALLRVEGAFPDGPPGTVSSWCIC